GFCRRVPWLGDWAMIVLGGWQMRRQRPVAGSTVPDLAARQAAETRTRGYLRSVLSSQRNMLAERLDEEHAELGRMHVPVLAVWGAEDRVIPSPAQGELGRLNRDARQVTIEGAGHGLVHTHPQQIASAISGFLRET